MKKFVSDLLKKSVATSDGTVVGSVENLRIDQSSGELKSIVVQPTRGMKLLDPSTEGEFERDPDGRYLIPIALMRSFRDICVVDVKIQQKQ
ncbi:hypothetical protein GCM10007108_16450 [Thermogymnomonas acidicola]|uniref:PRC-barrel domain-containing protein n=1 Tax=Thermogymnomonas acidicola TaxID=399579 RepID=A0AA37BTA2_9ARCH|nr:PRC-barrel domain-containing protein [Thermogymnomonas acidicola]GGM78970.1 hypothetical protein GCM10007108_16450 [Thermogymnomonas acidicola]